MRFLHALTFVYAATCFSSCLPLPVQYHTQPDIYGTVVRNGVPVAGAKVGYSDDVSDSDCDSPIHPHPTTVVSEANGAFHFEGTYSFFKIIYWKPRVDSVNGRICIDTSGGQHFSQELFMDCGNNVGSIPSSAPCAQLVINCDIGQDKCAGTAQ